MIDKLYYQSPLGWLGKLADSLFLKRYLAQFLEQRNQLIKKEVEKID